MPDQVITVSLNSITQSSSPKYSISHINDSSTDQLSSSKIIPVNSTVITNSLQSQEEKRQAVRKLIENIPTKKEDLFTYTLDWLLLDSVCVLTFLLSMKFCFSIYYFRRI